MNEKIESRQTRSPYNVQPHHCTFKTAMDKDEILGVETIHATDVGEPENNNVPNASPNLSCSTE